MSIRWLNNFYKNSKTKLLSIDLDYFNCGSGNILDIIDEIISRNIPLFWTYFHDEFLDIANENWEEIVNYDSHDDIAYMDDIIDFNLHKSHREIFLSLRKTKSLKQTNYLMEGTWIGLVKNKDKKRYIWKHNLYNLNNGRCYYEKNIWNGDDAVGYKEVKQLRTSSFDLRDIRNSACVGICVSPDYSNMETIDVFMRKYGRKDYRPSKLPTRR